MYILIPNNNYTQHPYSTPLPHDKQKCDYDPSKN